MDRIIIILLAVLLTGCKHTEYVPMPEYHERVTTHVDTVHITDSIRESKTSILQEVDSAFLADLGIIGPPQKAWLLREREDKRKKSRSVRISHDTIMRTDSVAYPVEKKVYVRTLYRWQKVLLYIGTVALLWVLVWIARMLRRTNSLK